MTPGGVQNLRNAFNSSRSYRQPYNGCTAVTEAHFVRLVTERTDATSRSFPESSLKGSHVFGQVAKVYSRGKRRHRNGSKEAQIFV